MPIWTVGACLVGGLRMGSGYGDSGLAGIVSVLGSTGQAGRSESVATGSFLGCW